MAKIDYENTITIGNFLSGFGIKFNDETDELIEVKGA